MAMKLWHQCTPIDWTETEDLEDKPHEQMENMIIWQVSQGLVDQMGNMASYKHYHQGSHTIQALWVELKGFHILLVLMMPY